MAQPDKIPFAGGAWRPADWLLPLSISVCLHLVLLGVLIIRQKSSPEIVWVNLNDTRPAPFSVPMDQANTTVPPRRQRPLPAPPVERHRAVQNTLPEATRPAPAFVAQPSPLATVTGEKPPGNVPMVAATGEGATSAPPANTSAAATGASPGPPETAAQRYLREQFAYIRERVKERLVYPPLARRQGWTGQVRVEFTICADGSIEGLKVAASSGRALLDRQALQAVRAAAPFPAPPAPAIVNLPVVFVVDSAHF